MANPQPKDNSTYRRKVGLRRLALEQLTAPVVMETHGGYGRLYLEVYQHLRQGVVFELDDAKVCKLAEQRPTWAVYQADCVRAIQAGAGAHLAVNLLDCDPYGEPWPVIDAFFTSERPRPERLVVVVNDGLRRNVRFGFAWHVASLEGVVEKYGNDLFDRYLDVCKEMLETLAAKAGYSLSRFAGYYCGEKNQMSHYLAVFTQSPSLYADPPSDNMTSQGILAA